MTKRLAVDRWSTLVHSFTSHYCSMTFVSVLLFTFHFLFNLEFENKAQCPSQIIWWDQNFPTRILSKFMMDIHVGVITKSNKTFPYFSTIYILVLYQIKQTIPYFTNDNDIHFSAISNQTKQFLKFQIINIVVLN